MSLNKKFRNEFSERLTNFPDLSCGDELVFGPVDPLDPASHGRSLGVVGVRRLDEEIQSYRDSVDLARVLARYEKGEIPEISFVDYLNAKKGQVVDVSGVKPFSWQNEDIIEKAQAEYNEKFSDKFASFEDFIRGIVKTVKETPAPEQQAPADEVKDNDKQ